MRHTLETTTIVAALLTLAAGAATAAPDPAQTRTATPAGTIVTPGSSIPKVGERGVAGHTNVHIFIAPGARPDNTKPSGKYETPASLACVYGLTAKATGCNPISLKTVATGGSKIVAIVDAYDDPTAARDLAVYARHYGLPPVTAANFQVVFAGGTRPAQDSSGGWELEESLDVDMAHALAPKAKVVLVEANSNSYVDLLAAETVAANLVKAAGGGEVSNSWSGGESSTENASETKFKALRVVFFASSGDASGTGFPSVLQNVISVGGTSLNRTASGNYIDQTTWSATGGGNSLYVPRPSYQSGVRAIVGTHRGTPDISLVANPSTGVWVYDTTPYSGTNLQWVVLGGTSVASPASAAIVNAAGDFNASTPAELTEVYANLGVKANFTDITAGSCPNAATGQASVGYDLCTGVGTPLGLVGK